jgi:colanic acid biosynthesis glycosyl transferase WcaI
MDANTILVLTRHYAPEPTGSAPPMQQLAEWLAGHGYPVHLVTARPSYPAGRITPGYERGQHDDVLENGVHVTRWPTTAVKGGGLFARVVPEARFMMQIIARRAMGRLPTSSAVISLCPSILTVFGALTLRTRGGRHVAIVHDVQSGLGKALGSPIVRMAMGTLARIERWSLNRVDHIVVLSDAMGATVAALGVTTPMTVLPPFIDCATIRPLPRSSERAPTLMYSGNLGRKQGLHQILDLAARLAVRAPEIRIVIRGEGVMRASLEERIRADALTNVALLPLVDAPEIPRSLAEGDIHLVPQIAEGGDFAVPSKAFAIMAAGRPFVTTATPGSSIAKLARDSAAFVCVPPDDADAFAQTVIDLLAQPDRCAAMGVSGRSYAETHADTDVVMRRIVALLRLPSRHDGAESGYEPPEALPVRL